MATVTDTLETVFKLTGAQQIPAAFQAAAAGATEMAAAEGVATAATVGLEAALAPLLVLLAPLLTLAAAIGFAKKSLEAFSESEDAVARLAVQMKNLGNVFPTNELLDFSSKLSQQTGIDDEAIASLGAMAVQFGVTRQQAEKLIPTVLDISVATKKSSEEVLQALLRASRGQTRGLLALGIDPSKIKGDLHDVNNLISQVGKGFAGTAAAFRGTLPGTIEALKTSVGNLFEAIGRFISPVVVPLLNLFIKGIDKATELLTRLADFLHIPTAAALGEGAANPLALKGDPEQTALLGKIESNTKSSSDALVKSVLGGPGTIAKGAATARDFRLAFAA